MLILSGLVVALAIPAPGQAATAPPRVTVIGDSVQASFMFAPQARRSLGRGLSLRMEARVCRRLSSAGCLSGTPESAVALVQDLGPRAGDVVIVNVGYNDTAGSYNVDAAMAAFRRAGVRAVVWVTLREVRPPYRAVNARIRGAARRAAKRGDQPLVRVADWNRYSAGHGGWFASDQVHLNGAGTAGLSALLRTEVLSVLAELGTSVDGRPVKTRIDSHRLSARTDAIAGDENTLWVAGGGRLSGRSDRNGHALPGPRPLTDGTVLMDGTGVAWLRNSDVGTLDRVTPVPPDRGRSNVRDAGGSTLLAGDDQRLWTVSPCDVADAAGCPTGQHLRVIPIRKGATDGETVVPLTSGTIEHIAVGKQALWVAAVDPAGRSRLDRRHPVTGQLLHSTGLPRPAVAVVAGLRGAWVLDQSGSMLQVDVAGRVAVRQRGLTAIVGRDDQLWAVRRDRRTIVNLHPVTARVRGTAKAGARLSTTMALTRRQVWALSDNRRILFQLPRA